MIDEKLTERLPVVRITPTLKQRLEQVVSGRRLGDMSDHIRFAVETYVASIEAQTAEPRPALQPTVHPN
jgi:Arc/MetJ-type ribon-helix-helix transcriptional regulator